MNDFNAVHHDADAWASEFGQKHGGPPPAHMAAFEQAWADQRMHEQMAGKRRYTPSPSPPFPPVICC